MIIVIIDACRNNPFEGKERGWGSVNLAPLFAPKGTLIAYSTSPGEKADDFGMDGHSVYTGALLKHLKEGPASEALQEGWSEAEVCAEEYAAPRKPLRLQRGRACRSVAPLRRAIWKSKMRVYYASMRSTASRGTSTM